MPGISALARRLADLVVINERASSYAQDMQQRVDAMCENIRLRGRDSARASTSLPSAAI